MINVFIKDVFRHIETVNYNQISNYGHEFMDTVEVFVDAIIYDYKLLSRNEQLNVLKIIAKIKNNNSEVIKNFLGHIILRLDTETKIQYHKKTYNTKKNYI